MLNLLQKWIERHGPLRAALGLTAVMATSAAVLVHVSVALLGLAGAPGGSTPDGAVLVGIVGAGAASLVIGIPGFQLIARLHEKERNQEDLIEQLQRTQDRLQASEDRFRNIAEAASDWFWEMDADLRFTYFSPRAEEIVGVPLEFHIGKTRAELAGEDVNSEKWQLHIDDLNNHRPFRDFRFIRKGHDGRLQTLTSSGKPIFDQGGTFAGYIGVGSDLTWKLETEEKAKLAQQRLANVIEGLWELFVLWDSDDRLVVCNEQFRRLNAEVIETTEPGTFFADHIRAGLDKGLYLGAVGREEAWFAERMARHTSPGAPFEMQRQNGNWLYIHEQRFPDGSVATVSMDITARKNAERDIMASKEAAEAANRSKSDFLARMSHELRTPLNAILGFSQIIRDESFGAINKKVYSEYARDIHASGELLLSLINDLLDLSRIEAGKFELEEKRVDIHSAAAEVIRLFERDADAGNMTLKSTVPADLPNLQADPRAIRQMLMNLVSNATKFTGGGGNVIVDAKMDGSNLLMHVVDTGKGFPEGRIDTALEPFGRLDQAETASAGGTGLGLPIVKSLIEMHGGTLRLRSTPGEGTTATLTFPASRILETSGRALIPTAGAKA